MIRTIIIILVILWAIGFFGGGIISRFPDYRQLDSYSHRCCCYPLNLEPAWYRVNLSHFNGHTGSEVSFAGLIEQNRNAVGFYGFTLKTRQPEFHVRIPPEANENWLASICDSSASGIRSWINRLVQGRILRNKVLGWLGFKDRYLY